MALQTTTRKLLSRTAIGVILLATVAVIVLYTERKPLAHDWIDQQLKARGVVARYKLTQLDPYHQRLEQVMIGDPAHPDLTADWIETETDVGWFKAGLIGVRAGGVQLHGVLTKDNALHFGELDKFRSQSTAPFSLPDLKLDLTNAQLTLNTTNGIEHVRLDGKGNLARNFDGRLVVHTAATQFGQCNVEAGQGALILQTHAGQPQLSGPIAINSVNCAGAKASGLILRADTQLSPDLTRASGHLMLQFASFDTPILANTMRSLAVTNGTPLAPIATQYVVPIMKLGQASAINTSFSINSAHGISLSNVAVASHSGARLVFDSPGTINIQTAKPIRFAGIAQLAGGGFPATRATLSGDVTHFMANATVATIAASNTRLTLTPISVVHDDHNTKINTRVIFDGPAYSADVRGLTVPISGTIGANGRFAPSSTCVPVSVNAATFHSTQLGKTSITICMNGSDIHIAAPRIAGRTNGTAFMLASSDTHYYLDSKALTLGAVTANYGDARVHLGDARLNAASHQFTLSRIAAQTGAAGHISLLSTDHVAGTWTGSALSGTYTNAAGQLPNVPLTLDHSSGNWAYDQGIFGLKGSLNVADTSPARRFEPLVSHNVILKLANSIITATGTLNEPKSGAFVTNVRILHNLTSASGNAALEIKTLPLLSFGKALQPEALTRATLGIVANLKGAVSGEGHIHWAPQGVTSDGRFMTEHMDLAAAFGPIQGLKGEIVFTDLLGLVSAPHQVVHLAAVNPGVIVNNGVITYQLLPGQRVAIEGGRFPLAGGALILAPTIMNLTQAAERRMTFRVEGVDAAKFINDYQFEDVAATGIFDGVMPLIFDAKGGRIEGGHIAVRQAGGVVSYVGPVSVASLGRYGKLAFDALKSMKYRGLVIDLQGPLDGEMVTQVSLAGTNQAPLNAQKSYLLKQITNLPFKFNIRITAPFRSLFTSTKNLQDPSDLVNQSLPKGLDAEIAPPVHPGASSIQK